MAALAPEGGVADVAGVPGVAGLRAGVIGVVVVAAVGIAGGIGVVATPGLDGDGMATGAAGVAGVVGTGCEADGGRPGGVAVVPAVPGPLTAGRVGDGRLCASVAAGVAGATGVAGVTGAAGTVGETVGTACVVPDLGAGIMAGVPVLAPLAGCVTGSFSRGEPGLPGWPGSSRVGKAKGSN